MLRRIISISAAAVISLTSAAWALEVRGPAAGIEVSYGDLDVTHAQGASVLLARISSAAHRVCGPEPANQDLGRIGEYRRCVHGAVERAVGELNIPLVSRLYDKSDRNEVAAAR